MTRNCLFFHIFKSGKFKFCTRPAIGMVHFLFCVKLRSAPLSSNPGTRSIRWQIAPESDRGACKTARPKDRVDKEERSNKHLLLDPMVVYTCIQIEKSYFLTIAGQTPLVCKLRVMSSALCQIVVCTGFISASGRLVVVYSARLELMAHRLCFLLRLRRLRDTASCVEYVTVGSH